ncbi:protein CREG1 [Nasonia vitripennis]|uniref:CREG-like beta-barrel domain-containing protein n=1 Tax=Nasonia vitripennis TaxID=7425 RepID=A0A7M7LUG3_NASVI|nr:protein CREG1 [Nasonia vitripennis]XP_008207745.1 protein CREG1 [Nasonia vitripennis]XP_032457608.1 protein CREG1 [Nasonia vitripennis]
MAAKLSVALVLLVAACASARTISQGPPAATNSALMARYIVNEAEWTSIATISVRENTKNYPFVNLVSLSDGLKGQGSGVPYIFVTPLDFTGQDLIKDQRVTMLMSLAQGDWCNQKGYDPMDPRCARVVLSGKIEQINEDHPDYKTAKTAFFGRHEWLAHMPENHHFYLAKLNIQTIEVLSRFGGIGYVTVDEYYGASPTDVEDYSRSYK